MKTGSVVTGPLIYPPQMLFTVNAGSDTVSMFSIDPQSPMEPKLVGSPVSTLGDFPISVDYSPQLHKGRNSVTFQPHPSC